MKNILHWIILLVLCAAVCTPAQESPAGDFSEESIQYDFALGLLRRGLATDAAVEFNRFITQFPQSKRINDALLERGQSYFAARDFQKAANDYYAWLSRTRSNDQRIRLRYGICLYELGKFKDALSVLSSITGAENLSAVNYYSGLALQKNGQPKDAVKKLAQITSGELHAPALFAQAECMQELKDFTAAAALYAKVTEKYPTHNLAEKSRLSRANALRLAGKLDQSAHGFDELVKSSDDTVRERALYGLAWTKLEEGKIDEALKTAGDVLVIVKDPQLKTGTHYLLGTAYFRKNEFSKAEGEYRQAANGDFADKSALGLGWTLYKSEKFDPALVELGRIDPQASTELRGEAQYLAGRCYWSKNDYKAAAAAFAQAAELSQSRNEQALYEQALALEKADDSTNAAERYEAFIKKFPESNKINSALSGMGRALLSAQRYEAAVMVYTRLLSYKNLTAEEKQSTLERQAVAYYYLKQYENMSLAYQQLLREFPDGEGAQSALYWLGWHELESKNYPAAITYYQKLIKHFPKSRFVPRSRYYLGSAYLRAGKDKEAAELFYTLSSEKENPLEERELLWLGKFLQESNEQPKAQAVYSRIIKNSKDSIMQALAIRGLALSYLQAKDWDKSLQTFDKLFTASTKLTGQIASAQAFANEALLGAAISLRELNKFAEAQKKLQTLRVSADDPFMAKVIFEKGKLAFAMKDYNTATAMLMRVGLLVADEQLAGEALWLAGQACERNNDTRKARVCYEELAGKTEGGYGKIYPKSQYKAKAAQRLKQIETAKAAATPATIPEPVGK